MRHDVWQLFAQHCKDNPHKHLPNIMHFQRVSQGIAWAIMPEYTSSDFASTSQICIAGAIRSALTNGVSDEPWLWPLISMASGLNTTIDLHSNNWMIDKDSGEVIITDPFSSTGKT